MDGVGSGSSASTSRSSFLASRLAQSSRQKSTTVALRANGLKSQLCGHCNKNLSVKTFKKHKKLYSRPDETWTKPVDEAEEDICSIDELPSMMGGVND